VVVCRRRSGEQAKTSPSSTLEGDASDRFDVAITLDEVFNLAEWNFTISLAPTRLRTPSKERIAYRRWGDCLAALRRATVCGPHLKYACGALVFHRDFSGGFQGDVLRSTRDQHREPRFREFSLQGRVGFADENFFPRSPRTDARACLLPDGVAAMARPRGSGAAGRRRVLASSHMLETLRGEFVARTIDMIPDISNPAPSGIAKTRPSS